VLATRPLVVSGALTIRLQSQLQRSRPPLDHTLSSIQQTRLSSSSTRWKTRQTSDPYTKSSKLTALKSRAAYKLLEINDKHKLFRVGQSVVDLGYAPGSWSQVAKNRVGESGRVVGIDVIPAQPPRGVSALQGDFLSEGVQGLVREFVREWKSGEAGELAGEDAEDIRSVVERARGNSTVEAGQEESVLMKTAEGGEEGAEAVPTAVEKKKTASKKAKKLSPAALDLQQGRVVDVVLSDMCAPFPGLEFSSWVNSVNRPYRRMMNTSGNPFRDHAGSIVRFAHSIAREEGMFVLTSCFCRICAWQR
jgi:21S rRNA (uridine2791-2'-O)-methyltransferase